MIQTLLSIVIICLLCGCCISKVQPLADGGFRPKKPNFEFAKEPFSNIENSIIDTKALYIQKIINTDKALYSADILYTFYRFFPSGQVYNSLVVIDHYPTNSDINNLKTGLIGYYKLKGDSIFTEFFVPISCGQYRVSKGKMKYDSIVFLSTSVNGKVISRSNRPLVLQKIKDHGLNFTAKPDW